jgi:2Fe-2S ferredoxin
MPDFCLDGVAVSATPGESVLAACQRAGVTLQTVCKGRGICGACRVDVAPDCLSLLTPPGKNETRLLNYLAPNEPTHRLGCQIILDDTLQGIRLQTVPLPVKTST